MMRLFGIDLIPHSKRNKAVLNALDQIKDNLIMLSYSYPVAADNVFLMEQHKFFRIPSDIYVETGLHLLSRIVKGKNDIPQSFEKIAAPYLNKIDFDKQIAILTIFDQSSYLAAHYHIFTERIIILSGEANIFFDRQEDGAREFVIEPYVVHHFKGLSNGMCLTIVNKKQQ